MQSFMRHMTLKVNKLSRKLLLLKSEHESNNRRKVNFRSHDHASNRCSDIFRLKISYVFLLESGREQV